MGDIEYIAGGYNPRREGGRVHRYWNAIVKVLVTMLMGTGLCTGVAFGSANSVGASTPKGSPINIGLVCSCTGAFASGLVDVPVVYNAWASSVNASGGINGHRINVISKDDQSNPGTSTSIVQNFVQSDHVVAIVDATTNDSVWSSYVQQQGVPVVGVLAPDLSFVTNPDFYAEGQTILALLPSIVGAVQKAKATKMALFYCAESATCQEAIPLLKTAAASANVQLVASLEVSASAPNYTAECLAAKQAGAQALFIADGPTVAEKIAADCTTQGYVATYVTSGQVLAPAMRSAPGLKNATYAPFPDLPWFANTPAIKQMNAALNKYAHGVQNNSTYGEDPVMAWISGKLFQAAAVAGHLGANGTAPTTGQLIKGLDSLNGTTLNGLAPPLRFIAGKANPVDCWFFATIKSGKFTMPDGLSPACETGA